MVIRPDVARAADALAPEIGREREYRLVGDPGARTDAGRSRGQLQPCEYLLLVDQIVVGRELLHEPDEFRVGENRADVVVARTGNGPLPVAVDAVVAQDQSPVVDELARADLCEGIGRAGGVVEDVVGEDQRPLDVGVAVERDGRVVGVRRGGTGLDNGVVVEVASAHAAYHVDRRREGLAVALHIVARAVVDADVVAHHRALLRDEIAVERHVARAEHQPAARVVVGDVVFEERVAAVLVDVECLSVPCGLVVLHGVVTEDGAVAVDAPQGRGGLHAVGDALVGEIALRTVAHDVVLDEGVVAAVDDDLVAGNPFEDVPAEYEARVGLAQRTVARRQKTRQTVALAVGQAAILDHQIVERRGIRTPDDVVVEDARAAAFVVVGLRAVDIGDLAAADVDVVHHAALDVVGLDADAGDLGPRGRALVGDPQVLQLPVLDVADQDGLVVSAACDFGQGQAFVAVGAQYDRRLGRTAAAQRERSVVDRAALDENRVAGLPRALHDAVDAFPRLRGGVSGVVVGPVFGVDVVTVGIGDLLRTALRGAGFVLLAGRELACSQQCGEYDQSDFHGFSQFGFTSGPSRSGRGTCGFRPTVRRCTTACSVSMRRRRSRAERPSWGRRPRRCRRRRTASPAGGASTSRTGP